MKLNIKTLSIILSLSVLSACSQRIGDFSVISSKNINLSSEQFTFGKRVKGEDLRFFTFPTIKESLDDAIEKRKCVVGLSDAFLEYVHTPIYFGYRVEGTQIIDTSLPGCSNK